MVMRPPPDRQLAKSTAKDQLVGLGHRIGSPLPDIEWSANPDGRVTGCLRFAGNEELEAGRQMSRLRAVLASSASEPDRSLSRPSCTPAAASSTHPGGLPSSAFPVKGSASAAECASRSVRGEDLNWGAVPLRAACSRGTREKGGDGGAPQWQRLGSDTDQASARDRSASVRGPRARCGSRGSRRSDRPGPARPAPRRIIELSARGSPWHFVARWGSCPRPE